MRQPPIIADHPTITGPHGPRANPPLLRLRTFGGLWIDRAGEPIPARPRSLALLAILAGSGAKGLTRDQALVVLWPESDAERGRHALSQTLYSLRRELGADVVRSSPDLRLQAMVASDVAEFREAIAGARWRDAAALHTGPFLDGVYLAEAPEFERWVEEQRAALAADAQRAIELAARQCADDGDREGARALWHRLVRLDPFNARPAVAYMENLAALGDREAALAHGRAYAALVRRELDAEPDRRVSAMMARLREEHAIAPPAHAPVPPSPPSSIPPSTIPPSSIPPSRVPPSKASRRLILATALVGIAALAAGWRAIASGPALDRASLDRRALVARRFYDEGLHAFYEFDATTAGRRFRAAMREDPTSALAAYRAWTAARVAQDTDQEALADRALELAAHAPTHDSLLIVTHIGAARSDVAALAAARALAANYPNDVEALVRAAEVLSLATVDAIPELSLLHRAVALDSGTATRGTSGIGLAPCRGCEARALLVERYEAADSLDAAERVIREWIAHRPADPLPWWLLAGLHRTRGRPAAADDAQRRYEALGGAPRDTTTRIVHALYDDDVETASRLCDRALPTPDDGAYANYRWYCTIGLRMAGRYRDAVALVREGRAPGSRRARAAAPTDPLLAAILDLEMGRGAPAAATFRAFARDDQRASASPGMRAHRVAWHLTLAATAAVADGDTLTARALVDTIEAVGQRSLAVRDPLLHHFVRGLLHAHAGRHEAAVGELRAALESPARGFTRINYELGRSLLALGRAPEAVPIVRAALHGGVEGPQLYVTRTELHELLAQAFAAAGQRDSAAAHRAIVARAWRGADPPFAARLDR